MKKLLTLLTVLVMVFGFTVSSQALLINRGIDSEGNSLIYDSDLDITWYDYSNSADSWENQLSWAQDLTVDFDGNIIDDWRLPVTYDQDHRGYSYTNSELGHLFYTELGNIGYRDTSGNLQAGYGLNNTGDFQNLVRNAYWSGTEYTANTIYSWYLYFNGGNHNYSYKEDLKYALAVHSGDVAAILADRSPENLDGVPVVPEPGTMILLGAGLTGLVLFRKKLGQIKG